MKKTKCLFYVNWANYLEHRYIRCFIRVFGKEKQIFVHGRPALNCHYCGPLGKMTQILWCPCSVWYLYLKNSKTWMASHLPDGIATKHTSNPGWLAIESSSPYAVPYRSHSLPSQKLYLIFQSCVYFPSST